MTFIDVAKLRFSSRHYLRKDVEKEKIIQVIEAARVAPSAANRQPWYFIIVQSEEKRTQLAQVYKRDWFKEAPVVIIACGDHSQSWKRPFDGKDHCDVDVSIAVDHITLAAADMGLATCWICAFNAELCRNLFKLPQNIEPLALLSLGYPADQADTGRHELVRKPLNNILFWEEFEQI